MSAFGWKSIAFGSFSTVSDFRSAPFWRWLECQTTQSVNLEFPLVRSGSETEVNLFRPLRSGPAWTAYPARRKICGCVYRKLKSGRSDGEARRGSGVNE